jgi:nitrate/nitrite transporter NarK
LALGVTTSGASCGTIYLGLVSTGLIEAYGWRTAMQVLAALTVAGVGCVSFVFRVPGGHGALDTMHQGFQKHCGGGCSSGGGGERGPSDVESKDAAAAGDEGRASLFRAPSPKGKLQVLALLRHPRFSRLCVAYLCVAFAFDVPFVHLVRFALDRGMGADAARLLPVGIGGGGLVRVLVTSAADRFGRERVFTAVLASLGLANAMLPTLIGSAGGAWCYALVVGVCSGVLVALVLPLATAASAPRSGQTDAAAGAEALASVRSSEASGSGDAAAAASEAAARAAAAADWPPSASITSGLVYSTIALGVFLGPIGVGEIYDATGSYDGGFWACGALCACAAIVSVGLIPPEQRSGQIGAAAARCCGGGGGGGGGGGASSGNHEKDWQRKGSSPGTGRGISTHGEGGL